MNTADVHKGGSWPRWPGRREWLRVARQTGNPLLRRPTRRERVIRRVTWWALTATAFALMGGCVLVYRSGLVAERAEADRHPVTVTVVGQEPSSGTGHAYLSERLLVVSYRVNGEDRQATMPAMFGVTPGATLDAWADRNGHLAPRPQTHLATIVQTFLAAVGGLLLLVGLGLGCRAGLAAWVTRLRFAEWDAEWLRLDSGHTS